MKKIIATVLAMVMALALCSTAFAASSTTLTAEDYKGLKMKDNTAAFTGAKTDTLTYYAEEKSTTTVDGKTTVTITPAYYVYNSSTYVVCDDSYADVKIVKDGKVVDYAKYVTGAFTVDTYKTSKVVTKTIEGVDEPKCGQYKDGTYYVIDGDVYSVVDDDHSTVAGYALLNGKLVAYAALGTNDFVDHKLDTTKVIVDKGTVTSVYCSKCEKYVPVVKTIPANSVDSYKSVQITITNGTTTTTKTYYYLTSDNGASGSTSGSSSGTKPSPKTFDAGIALYAAMALTSVAGSAVVIGKKKEF